MLRKKMLAFASALLLTVVSAVSPLTASAEETEEIAYTFEDLLEMDKNEIRAMSDEMAEYVDYLQEYYLANNRSCWGFQFSMIDYAADEDGVFDNSTAEKIYKEVALPEDRFEFSLTGAILVKGTDENGEPYEDKIISGRFNVYDYYENPLYDYNEMYVFTRFAVYMRLNPYVRAIGFSRIAGSSGSRLGDVNEDGKIDAADASAVLAEYSAAQAGESAVFTRLQQSVSDVNCDGITDSMDASEILSYYARSSTGTAPSWN